MKFENIDIDETISHEQYVEFLYESFIKITKDRFPNDRIKQQVRKYKTRIVGSCPVCGDSMKSSHKHRGNIILTGKFTNYYKCFNCGIFKRIDYFLKDYHIDIDLSIINYISAQIQDFSNSENVKSDMSLFLDMNSLDKYAINRQEFLKYFGLVEVKNSPVWPWLTKRLQYDDKKFLYNANKNYLVILNLTPSGKILGVQKRAFKGVNKYLTYKLSKIYELFNMTPEDIPEEINDISSLFNICLINYTRPIVLLEGPLDSFLIKNSIANTGANKNFPLNLPLKYLYDKDETGVKKSIEHIKNGEEVFLWEKFLKDVNAPYRKKWDITDIFMWAKENNTKLPDIHKYFSNDTLDMIDI